MEYILKDLTKVISGGLRRHVGRKFPPYEAAMRMGADMVMLNVGLMVGLLSRYVWLVVAEESTTSPRPMIGDFLTAYLNTFWMLTLISLVIFHFAGFYSFGRFYRGRYKMLVVARAVSISYLVFGLVLLLLRDVLEFPRVVLLAAWPITLVLLVGARLWATIWSTVTKRDRPPVVSSSAEDTPRRVLVIGGAGYIGSALVERLLELGYRVRVLDLLIYGDEPIAHLYGNPNFELYPGDFRHIDTVVRATKGVDAAVVHLGAIVGDSACSLCEDLTIEINLGATRTIAEISKGYGIDRFIFASTCSVYGASNEILDEKSALCPLSLYARTKLAAENLLLGMTDHSFSPTILRFATVYGLSRRPRFDLVVNLLAAKAVQEGEVGIYGGSQWRPLVHVRDVAESIVLALRSPTCVVSGQIFNVGSNEQNYQIGELGTLIKEMVPTARVVLLPTEDNRNYRVRFDKIHNALGFEPRYTVRDGIAEIKAALTSGQIADYRDARYNNYSFLKDAEKMPQILPKDMERLYEMASAITAARRSEGVLPAVPVEVAPVALRPQITA